MADETVDPRLVPQVLPGLLLGGERHQRAGARALDEADRWDEAVRLAIAWRVVPLLHRSVTALGHPLPPVAHERLAQSYRAAAASSTVVAHRGAVVGDTLARAGLAAVLLKGVASIATLYAAPAERTVSDVDLLVDQADMAAADALLRELGYEPDAPRDPQGRAKVARFRLLNPAVVYRSDGVELDVHTRLGTSRPDRLDTGRLVARRRPVQLLGRTVNVLDPVDAMLVTVHHSLRDRFAPLTSVKDLADLATALEQADDRRLEALADAAGEAELGVPLAAMVRVLERYGHPGARRSADALDPSLDPGDRRDAERLVGLFDHQLRHGALSRGLIELLSPHRIHFFRRLVPRRWRRPSPAGASATGSPGRESAPRAGLARLARDGVNPRALTRYTALIRAQKGFRS